MHTYKMFFFLLRMNIQLLEVSSREDTTVNAQKTYLELRLQVTTFLHKIHSLVACEEIENELLNNCLHSLYILLGSIETISIIKIIHNCNSIAGNEVNQFFYTRYLSSFFFFFNNYLTF